MVLPKDLCDARRVVPPCLSSIAQRMERITCSLGLLCFAVGRDSLKRSQSFSESLAAVDGSHGASDRVHGVG